MCKRKDGSYREFTIEEMKNHTILRPMDTLQVGGVQLYEDESYTTEVGSLTYIRGEGWVLTGFMGYKDHAKANYIEFKKVFGENIIESRVLTAIWNVYQGPLMRKVFGI